MRLPFLALLLVSLGLSGCDGSSPELELAAAYQLASVDGGGLPAVLAEATFPDGAVRQVRLRGRSIAFVSADSADYALSRDIVEPTADGGGETWASSCVAARVPYQRFGDAVILRWDPNQFVPVGQPPSAQPPVLDTLHVMAAGLRHRAGEASLEMGSGGRRWELEYRAGPAAPLCGDLP